MNNKKGLGRGLDVLFGVFDETSSPKFGYLFWTQGNNKWSYQNAFTGGSSLGSLRGSGGLRGLRVAAGGCQDDGYHKHQGNTDTDDDQGQFLFIHNRILPFLEQADLRAGWWFPAMDGRRFVFDLLHCVR